jgi:hypothetical protein
MTLNLRPRQGANAFTATLPLRLGVNAERSKKKPSLDRKVAV